MVAWEPWDDDQSDLIAVRHTDLLRSGLSLSTEKNLGQNLLYGSGSTSPSKWRRLCKGACHEPLAQRVQRTHRRLQRRRDYSAPSHSLWREGGMPVMDSIIPFSEVCDLLRCCLRAQETLAWTENERMQISPVPSPKQL